MSESLILAKGYTRMQAGRLRYQGAISVVNCDVFLFLCSNCDVFAPLAPLRFNPWAFLFQSHGRVGMILDLGGVYESVTNTEWIS